MKKIYLLLVVLFFFGSPLALGQQCGPPVHYGGYYDILRDSYIVIKGTLHGLPSNYESALVFIHELSFNPSLPSSCVVHIPWDLVQLDAQTPSRNYYCIYLIFKHTNVRDSSRPNECWEAFRNLRSISVKLGATVLINGEWEGWDVNPSSTTLNIGPVKPVPISSGPPPSPHSRKPLPPEIMRKLKRKFP